MATDRLKKKIAKGRHMSQIKRDRQNETLRTRNRAEKTRMRSAVKEVRTEKSKDSLAKAVPLLMKAARRGVIHRKKASRLVSRLTKTVNAAKA